MILIKVLIQKRKFLSNRDLVKYIEPLSKEVNKTDMKVKLRGTNKPVIDFFWLLYIIIKMKIWNTILNIVANPYLLLENIFHNRNKGKIILLPADIILDETTYILLKKLFYNTENLS